MTEETKQTETTAAERAFDPDSQKEVETGKEQVYSPTEKTIPDAEESVTTETETKAENESAETKKYAGRYDSVEDLEKGYSEANKELQRMKKAGGVDPDKLAALEEKVDNLDTKLDQALTGQAHSALEEQHPWLADESVQAKKAELEQKVASGEMTSDQAITAFAEIGYQAGRDGKGVSDTVTASKGSDSAGTSGRVGETKKPDPDAEHKQRLKGIFVEGDDYPAFS